jgi:CRP/FNR family transcriptional regulator, cyclic AMP receptor protein
MSLNEEVDLLRKIPLFAKIDPSKLKLLAFASERISYATGEELVHQGDIGDAAYIIIAGEAEVLINTPSGPVKVATVGKNDFVGEIAILCDVPRTASVKATSGLTALKITRELFFRMVTDFPEMGVEIMRVLALRLDHANARLREALAAH